jgi:two-component system, sensor histidine kinase and response regulator
MTIDEYINRQELNERLGGDMELFKDLADIFLHDSTELLEKIEDALEQKDAEVVGKTAHTLKGAVSNFSVQKTYDAALALEKIGRSGDLSNASGAFKTLMTEIENAKQAIDALTKKETIL